MFVKSETLMPASNGGNSARMDEREVLTDEREALIGQTTPEIVRTLIALDEKPYRGRQVADWIYRIGSSSFETMTNLPVPLRERLAKSYRIGSLTETARRELSDRRTRKVAFTIPGGGVVESVFMSSPTRYTFCLSSQLGCGLACRFCATGRMGRGRNLTAGEILEQAIYLRRELPQGQRDFNVVLMGMGE